MHVCARVFVHELVRACMVVFKHILCFKMFFNISACVCGINRISIPLVWRYSRQQRGSEMRTIIQFKASIADVDTFDKSEWGPWEYAVDTRFDDLTNQMESKQVDLLPTTHSIAPCKQH